MANCRESQQFKKMIDFAQLHFNIKPEKALKLFATNVTFDDLEKIYIKM